jgi:FeS assembly protein IscX
VKWTDTQDIAMALADAHPDKDPRQVNFVDLYKWVMALPEFSDDPKRCGEKSSRRSSRRGSTKRGNPPIPQTPLRNRICS